MVRKANFEISNGFRRDGYGDVLEYKYYPEGLIDCHARVQDFVTINRRLLMSIPLFF